MSEQRTPSSLAWKINANWTRRLFFKSVFISIAVTVLALGTLWYITVQNIADIYNFSRSSKTLPQLPDYILSQTSAAPGGIMPGFLGVFLPDSVSETYHSLSWYAYDENGAVTQYPVYTIAFKNADGYMTVGRKLDSELRIMFYALIALLIWLGITWLLAIPRGLRSARRILSPISDMASAAWTLQEKKSEPRGFDDMTGTISSISAAGLDTRIDINNCQQELRGLARAINSMLDRVSAAYKTQARFVSDASHELRTPLAIIQGYAGLLDRWGKENPETLQESIDCIRSEAEYMKNLVENLLFLARGDASTLKLSISEFSVNELLEEILRETKMIDKSHDISLEIKDQLTFLADRTLLKQALRTILDNAIKFTPPEGRISIGAALVGSELRIIVEDRGIGISSKALPHIFDRFFRADESRDRKTGGAGLGMPIAKWIAEKHGGHFEVASWENIGTRVTLVLPERAVFQVAE